MLGVYLAQRRCALPEDRARQHASHSRAIRVILYLRVRRKTLHGFGNQRRKQSLRGALPGKRRLLEGRRGEPSYVVKLTAFGFTSRSKSR